MNNNLGCDPEYLLHRTAAQSSTESDDSRVTDWTVAADPGKCCQTETKLDAPLQSKSSEVQEGTLVITCNGKSWIPYVKKLKENVLQYWGKSHARVHRLCPAELKKLKRAELLSQRMKTSDHPEIPVPTSETPWLAWTKVNGVPLNPFNTKCHP